jgi:uncharacterized protein (DUF4415 family)
MSVITKKPKAGTKLVDIDPSELDLKRAKAKLSMWIDGDVLEAIRSETLRATGSKKGYQTFLNKKLREVFLGETERSDDQRLAAIEERLRLLEQAVGV